MHIDPKLLPVFIPIYGALIGASVCFSLSRMGWHGFAKKYRATTRPSGPSFNCRGVWFGTRFASYNNAVRVVFSETGVYIYPLILIRAFHPPFLVPWDKVVGVAEKKWVWTTSQELEVRDGTGEIHLTLSEEALQEYRKYREV